MLEISLPAVCKKWKARRQFFAVQKQRDTFNCDLFALAFASVPFDGKSPIHGRFVLLKCVIT